MSGTNGGIWRSEDTGKTWAVDAGGQRDGRDSRRRTALYLSIRTRTRGTTGNLQIVFAGMEGQGVFMSPNQGQVWSLMAGNVGNPLIIDVVTGLECESG